MFFKKIFIPIKTGFILLNVIHIKKILKSSKCMQIECFGFHVLNI